MPSIPRTLPSRWKCSGQGQRSPCGHTSIVLPPECPATDAQQRQAPAAAPSYRLGPQRALQLARRLRPSDHGVARPSSHFTHSPRELTLLAGWTYPFHAGKHRCACITSLPGTGPACPMDAPVGMSPGQRPLSSSDLLVLPVSVSGSGTRTHPVAQATGHLSPLILPSPPTRAVRILACKLGNQF